MPIINTVISGGGTQPAGTINITSNGTHNVADYEYADVQVPTTAPAHYIEKAVDANGKLIGGSTIMDFTGVTNVGDYVLSYAYCQISFPANTSADLSGLTTISGVNACQYMFQGCTGLTSVDLSRLTTISSDNACQYMFQGCTSLTSVNLSSLTTVSSLYACQYMFQGCTGLTSVDLSGLTTINYNYACQYMFQGCTGLTSVDLSGLTTINGVNACYQMFLGCGLTSVYLKSLKRIENYFTRGLPMSQMFGNCPVVDLRNLQYAGDYTLDSLCYTNATLSSINLNSLEHIGKEGARTLFYLSTPSSSLSEIKFPMLTSFGNNPFYTNAFAGRTNLTIHFRKDAQATVEALANYATLWGAGTGSSVVFDLAGTLTGADSNSYTRSEKDSVYASETAGAAKTATAWSYNNTIYYTSGGAEPQVGATIYSDSACTTAVTTVSAIA